LAGFTAPAAVQFMDKLLLQLADVAAATTSCNTSV